MILRPFWNETVEKSWRKKGLVWLAGVRRSGKTTLAKSIADSEYFNCDDPELQSLLKNPAKFLKGLKKKKLVLDEVHQLENASQVLKIAADEFSNLKVLATGSSTLVATKKFSDTLTGRKRTLHFVPLLPNELESFGAKLDKRLLFGGLPPALLSKEHDREFYAEWLDSFYARDIQEIFAIEKRQAFLKVFEFLLIQNGSQIEVTEIAKAAGLSRPTIIKYIEALEITKAISILRPFSANPLQEIVSQPKVYAFDTGFVCFARGETELGATEKSRLLENLVLESLLGSQSSFEIKYWRDKRGHEIDFVIPISKQKVLTIECKSKSRNYSPKNLTVFRKSHPSGENWVVTLGDEDAEVNEDGLKIQFLSLKSFFERVQELVATN